MQQAKTQRTVRIPSIARNSSHEMLMRLAKSWPKRAEVRRSHIDSFAAFDPKKPDFLEELLPFFDHPRYQRFNAEQRQRTLSSAWLIYNAKTLDIERFVVTPVCNDIIADDIPGLGGPTHHELAAETQIDESYHVLLTANAMSITRSMRDLTIRLPESILIKMMRACEQEYVRAWQRQLVRFATGLVSEIFISDYLMMLSNASDIQPINRETVDSHRRDEAAHGVIFGHLAKIMYQALSPREREFFASILPRPVRWFADRDLDIWFSVFEQLGIDDVRDMVEDCRPSPTELIDNLDYSGLITLARELGITETSLGRGAFEFEGLLG